ncbi:protein ORF14A [Pigeon adenovirus 1]|uniref:Protein ORF14A n=1 Tax=Pigeon adenovirus 1 TaxID=764030 RepID=X5LU04_9ADEN|nr:protein ORF14A [Pigeon adenovirus 1]CDO33891.1 protein ORF14A [Pigeon adenovirus 1]
MANSPDTSSTTTHSFAVTVTPFIHRIPAHLLFDLDFLRFLMGDTMFPHRDESCYRRTDVFPHLLLPDFSVHCHLHLHGEVWCVSYRCSCPSPHSLFCWSLAHYAVQYWINDVLEYLDQQEAVTPWVLNDLEPLYVAPCDSLVPWYACDSPVACLYYLLSHRTVRHTYAVGRTSRGFVLEISPPYFHARVQRCIQFLKLLRHQLPFHLTLDCFPYVIVQ